MSKYILLALFFLVAALPFLPFFKESEEESLSVSGDAETIQIISPHNREVKMEYSRGFREWMRLHHGREVEIRWLEVGGTSKLLKDLASRFAAHPEAPGVDLLFGGGVDPYIRAAKEGWLARIEIDAETLKAIPERCAGVPVYDPERRWFGVALSGFGIIYNRSLLGRLGLKDPLDWADIADPSYYSWVGSGDPRSSGAVHMCYEIILQAYGFEKGWALITRLCANVRRFGEGGGTAPREVAAGDVAAGMVIDQYAQRTIASMDEAMERIDGAKPEPSPLGFCLPQGATIITPDAIGVLNGAPHPELARLLVQFSLSEVGQRLLFQPAGIRGQRNSLFRMPVRKQLYADADAPAVNPFSFETGISYDDHKGGDRWGVLNDLIGKWCVDAHAELTLAWRAIQKAGAPEDLVRRLGEVPLAENELLEMAKQWKDSRIRQCVLNAWATTARARYRALAEEAKTRQEARGR